MRFFFEWDFSGPKYMPTVFLYMASSNLGVSITENLSLLKCNIMFLDITLSFNILGQKCSS